MMRATVLEVLTPPAADLVALSDVKALLDITGTDDDTVLAGMISRASAQIVSYAANPILTGSYRETIHTGESPRGPVTLTRFPVTDITSVTLDGEAVDDGDWQLDGEFGFVYRVDTDGHWFNWPRFSVVVVEYTAGFATTPADVQHAALTMIAADYSARGRDPGLRSISVGSINLGYFGQSGSPGLASVSHLIDPYRQPGIG